MKKLLSFFCLLASVVYVSAQNVIGGTVIDHDGNPIPGAKVVIVGSTESIITDLDGTFRLETKKAVKKVQVFYVGMQTKVQVVKSGMVVKLSKTNWWNSEPQKYSWFFNAQGAFPENSVKNPSFGLMLGQVKTFGWFIKGVYSSVKSTDGIYESYLEFGDIEDRNNYWTTGKDKRSFYAATAGVLIRLHCPIHLYSGAGYANRKVAWELADGTYTKNTEYSYSSVVLDYGLMLRLGKLSLNGGVLMSLANGCKFTGNAGIGICF